MKLIDLQRQYDQEAYDNESVTDADFASPLIADLIKNFPISSNLEINNEVEKLIDNASHDLYLKINLRDMISQTGTCANTSEYYWAYQNLVSNLKKCGFLVPRVQVKLSIAEHKNAIKMVFPTMETLYYAIRYLGGDNSKFSDVQIAGLKRLSSSIFNNNPTHKCLMIEHKSTKSGKVEIDNKSKTLSIPAYVKEDNIYIVFPENNGLERFKTLFQLENQELHIKSEKLEFKHSALLRVAHREWANRSGYSLPIPIQQPKCARTESICFFFQFDVESFPEALVLLIAEYENHECAEFSVDCGQYREPSSQQCIIL